MWVISWAMGPAFKGLSSDVAIDRPTIELFLKNSLRFIGACPLYQTRLRFSRSWVWVCRIEGSKSLLSRGNRLLVLVGNLDRRHVWRCSQLWAGVGSRCEASVSWCHRSSFILYPMDGKGRCPLSRPGHRGTQIWRPLLKYQLLILAPGFQRH